MNKKEVDNYREGVQSRLEELTLIKVEKWMISDKGRKYKVYRSRIKQAEISIKKPEPVLILVSN